MKSLLLLLFVSTALAGWTIDDMVSEKGFHAKPVDHSLINPWPAELEAEFQKRAQHIIKGIVRDQKPKANTYFENEKKAYGFCMAHVLGGEREKALESLQGQDHQHKLWHRETDGIDYYAAFTLKHQIRKYFYFGDLLDPAYKKQMFTGAKKWTAQDPMKRPHYAFNKATGWGPDAKNSWVDIRTTENLHLMRVTSVFLMAEETGNKAVANKYKDHLLRYTATLYRIGIGEWDSENYHGHSIAPLLNLFDFAKDLEVQRAAKACLDFYAAAGAVKYYRGGFNGPTKRDYNHAQPFGGSAANSLWVWFGDQPTGKDSHWESDEIHMITSSYRPPLAVVKLAQKDFKKPVELFAAKPPYSATTSCQMEARPEYLETQYLAHSYLIGSLTQGTSVDGGDVNGFKILAFDADQGSRALHASPSANPLYPGSPMYKKGIITAPNRVAQLENLALWLVKDGKSPWLWVLPPEVEVSQKNEVTFLKADRTWVAIRTLGASPLKRDSKLTKLLQQTKKSRFPDHFVISTQGSAEKFCGLAIEVGEQESHGSFAKFREAALAAKLDLSDLQTGAIRYKSQDGKHLGIHWNDDPLDLGVWRNGKRRDLSNPALYQSSIITAKWGEGILKVRCGTQRFQCSVGTHGAVTWK
ncbi:MAG: hypothetical protein ACON5H_03465 [Akkermansiaceae bacterium]